MTVATNMAGRGTDIELGKGISDLGGLHVILTEYHDSRRIDRQLFGRAGRQGDRGSCEAIVSLEDDIFEVCAPGATALLQRLTASGACAAGRLWRAAQAGPVVGRAPPRRDPDAASETGPPAQPHAGIYGKRGMMAPKSNNPVLRCMLAASLLAAWPLAHANPYECLIEPNQSVEIRSSVEGVIEKVFVKRGDKVRA
ncbi:hypothetical protein LP419_39850 [Massilia sp. H-1]|nr:hypothetical protein LP419_39850 [Massilia sp. H-1]